MGQIDLFTIDRPKPIFWVWSFGTGSPIEWTGPTRNPFLGCKPESEGCINCYAARQAYRFNKVVGSPYFGLTSSTPELRDKKTSKLIRPKRIFFNGKIKKVDNAFDKLRKLKSTDHKIMFIDSFSDIFYEGIAEEDIQELFQILNKKQNTVFQILTKRADRLKEIAPRLKWTPNIWIGTSVENKKEMHRVDTLRSIAGPSVRFLSCEPLLGSLNNINLDNIQWLIAGGESGPYCRPIDPMWVQELRDKCLEKDVPFFFKQWGGRNKKKNGRTLDGCIYSQFPKNFAIEKYAKKVPIEYPAKVKHIFQN